MRKLFIILTIFIASAVSSFAQYTQSTTTYSWDAPTTSVSTTSCNDCRYPLTIPFSFSYFGNSYTSCEVSTNGWLSFTSQASSYWTNTCLPNSAVPNNLIAAFWDDLDFNYSCAPTTFRYGTYGTSPNRRFVVTWESFIATGGSCDGKYVSMEVKLFETTNVIEVHLKSNALAPGNSGTIGIENIDGTIGYQAICNANTTNGTAWRWTPTGSAPVNDNCTGAVALTVGSTCSYTTGNVANATQSQAGCTGTANDDVWYSFVANSPNQTITVVGSSGFDAVVEIFTGSCGALTSAICRDATVGGGTTETINGTGFTVGNTYYYRVYDWYSSVPSTTTFQTCVTGTPLSGVPTTGDCLGSIKVCQNTYNYSASVSGIGNVADLGTTTPCGTYEKNSTWYIFTVESAGNFMFTLNSTADYDWALYNITGKSCADIAAGTLNSIRCNFSATTGNTGMSASGVNANEGASGSVWCTPLAVSAGETFALLVDNYSGGTVGYSLNFGTGTAGIFDDDPPFLQDIISSPACGNSTITVSFNELIAINSVDATDFTLTSGSTTYTITSAVGVNGTANDQQFILTTNTALTAGGTYTLSLTGQVADACNNTVSTSSLNFIVTGVSANMSFTNPTCFNGTNGAATATVTGGTPPYTYLWSTGATTSSISGLGVGTYTVTVRDNNGAGPCQDVQSVTLSNRYTIFEDDFDPSPNAGWTTGAITGTSSWATGQPQGGNGSSTYSNPDPTQDHSPNADNKVYGQGLGAGTSGGYNNSSNEWLRTPVINCSNATGVILSFWRLANFEANYDEAYVEISTNGTTWTSLGHPIYPQDNIWTKVTFDISAYANNQATVYIRWRSDNDASATYSGWNIDDVEITANLTALSAATTSTSVNCFGGSTGSATATPAGGVPTYTYAWSGGGSTATISSKPAGTYTVTVTDSKGCTATQSVTITQPSAALSISSTKTDVSCFGGNNGSIDITVSGGTAAYTYNWGGGVTSEDRTGLTAGTYTVSVTDSKSCTTTHTVTITQPAAALSIALASQTNVSCFGGSNGAIDITVSGGTTSYAYNWGGGVTSEDRTGLSAGVYTVTVTDANSCTATRTVTITQPAAALSIALTSQTNVSCFGGSNGAINITVSGGTTAYSYNWGGGVTSEDRTGLSAGVYTVTVTDANSCTATRTVTITQPASALAVTVTSQTNVSCNAGSNGSINITASGGTPAYTYNWGGGVTSEDRTGLSAGTYTVTVTDANSCIATVSATITQPSALTVTITKTDVSCNGGNNGSATATPSGGTAGYSYSWNDISFQATQTANGLVAGTYAVTVTDANSCTVTGNVTITQPLAITTTISTTQATCGGTNGTATVVAGGGAGSFTYDWSPNGFTGDGTTTYSALPSGTYTVSVYDASSCLAVANANVSELGAPTANISAQTNVSCNGGSDGQATVNVVGGTLPYVYSWNTIPVQTTATATGLSAGVYSVNVIDNNGSGCSTSASVTITQPAVLNASITSQVNVLCNGASTGSATVSISGGTSNYNYNWPGALPDVTNTASLTNTVNGLAAGTYTVTITDSKSCSKTATVTITQPTALTASIAKTDVSCFGGNNGVANLTVAGGTAPYTYLWSNTSTNEDLSSISAGTYNVTVTDANSCTTTASTTISQPGTSLNVSIVETNVACFNGNTGAADLTVSGGTSPYSYLWSNAATTQDISSLIAGTYSATVTDINNCTGNASVTISQPTSGLSASIAKTDVNCFGQSTGAANLTVSGGTPAYTFAWSNSEITEDLTNIPAGTYSVTITDANLCTTNASTTITQPVVALNASISGSNVSCFGGSNGIADLSVNGGTAPYTYNWSNSTTNQDLLSIPAGAYSVTVTDSKLCTTTASVTITQPIAALSASITGTNVNCNGSANGAANLTVSGGTTPYAYNWNTGQTSEDLTSLNTGSYSVTVTDVNLCTATASVTITQPSSLSVIANRVNISCNGLTNGSATATPSGGTSPYTYAWTGGQTTATATNLGVGSYTVTVSDANLCTATATVTITQPTALNATIAGTNVTCNGDNNGLADLTVSGGTIPYIYSWSNTSSNQDLVNIGPGTYSVTITDNKLCTTTASVVITEPAALSVSLTGTNVKCRGGNDGSANLVVSGGTTPYAFNWNTGQTTQNLSSIIAGTYTVTLTDANTCASVNSITITQPAAILNSSIVGTNINCNGQTTGTADLTPTGGTSPYTYLWNSGQTTQDLFNISAGNYSVTTTDANLCTSIATVTITEPLALTGAIIQTNILCFGNSTGVADLSVNGGTPPYSYLWSSGNVSQDLNNIPAGIYTVTITDNKSCTYNTSATITQPAQIVLTTSSTNSTCNNANGSATVSVTGGVSPYVYSWSTGQTISSISSVTSGAYGISVTDANNCLASASVNVNDAGAPTVTIGSIIHVNCNGNANGAATANATGGTTPYSYAWSNGPTTTSISGVSGGIYSVTITDANSCKANASVTITEPAVLIATSSIGNVNCNGGNNGFVNLNVTGGTTPYTYIWSSGQTTQNISTLTAGNYTVTVTDSKTCTTTLTATVTQPTILNASTTVINTSANGVCDGSSTVTPAGGTSPYTYLWSSVPSQNTATATNLCAGTYTVTVTDSKGCTSIQTVTITEPNAMSLSYVVTNVDCYSNSTGAVDLSVTGGTTPYTYLWTGGYTTQDLTNVTSGIYTVTVTDANSYTSVVSVNVTQPLLLVASISKTNVSCYGASTGAANLTVTGGTLPYSYLWSNGATTQNLTNIVAGIYTVTITDNNSCQRIVSTTITQPAADLAMTNTLTNVLCFGQSTGAIDITVSGGTSPYYYNWSSGHTSQDISSVPAGIYSVTVADANSCSINNTFTITEPATGMSVSNITGVDVLCYGGNTGSIDVTVSGGTPPYTYAWNTGQTTEDLSNLLAGTYNVTVYDGSSCYATSTYTINQPATAITLTMSKVNSNCGLSDGQATVTATGGVVAIDYTYLWSTGGTTATITGLNPGTYFVTVTDDNGCTKIKSVFLSDNGASDVAISASGNVSCNGVADGFATVSVLAGTPPYTYAWSTSANTTDTEINLSGGVVSVSVTDGLGCVAVDSVTIIEPNILLGTINVTNVKCFAGNDGIVDLTVTGGTTPFTYTWNTTATSQDLLNVVQGTYNVTITDFNGCSTTATGIVVEPASALSASSVGTNITCNGANNGSIDLTSNGGTSPYTYLWNYGYTTEDISSLNIGTYVVTVTDANGCTQTSSVTITQPAPITVSIVTTEALCYSDSTGSAVATVFGGTAPLTYLWDDYSAQTTLALNNVPSGTYTITVTDANSCTKTASVSISQPDSLQLSLLNKDVYCKGDKSGAAYLSVTGGKTGYSYLWSNGFTSQDIINQWPGVYCVTVTDANGCVQTGCTTISEPALELTLSSTVSNVNCFAGADASIDLDVTGGTPGYTYLWNYGQTTQDISGLQNGYYAVTVTDANGCSKISSYIITQPTAVLNATIGKVNPTCGLNNGYAFATAVGGTSPYSFVWSNASTTDTIYSIIAGTYYVTVTDANGCTQILSADIQDMGNPVAVISASNQINCYGGNNGSATVFVSNGTSPFIYNWTNGNTTSTASNLAAGTYGVTITDNNGCTTNTTTTITQPDSLYASIQITAALCYGDSTGSIDLSVVGGTAPYTYLWSSGQTSQDINNMVAGTYTATVTDSKTCQAITQTITITQPTEPITITYSSNNVTCNSGTNGAINVTITGGTQFSSGDPYIYSWNYGATTEDISGLIAGVYEITVTDANSCKKSQLVVITQPSIISIDWTTIPSNCGQTDGSATITSMTGGVAPYTWVWSNGASNVNTATGLGFGQHSVTVTDASNCNFTFNIQIQNQGTNPVIVNTSQIKCYGGYGEAIAVMQAGIAPLTYSWSNGVTTQAASNLQTGQYTVTVVDSIGCTGTGSTTIAPQPSQITATISKVNVTCKGFNNGSATVHASGGTEFSGLNPYNYLWNDSLATTDSIVNNLKPNINYTVIVTDANGCVLTQDVLVTEPAKTLSVGTDTIVTVSCFGGDDGMIQVVGIGGTSPYTYAWSNSQYTASSFKLSQGSYTVTVKDINNCTASKTISVSQPQEIIINNTVVVTSCRDSYDGAIELTVTGGVGNYAYLWNTKTIETSFYIENVRGDDYVVTVTDGNNCQKVDTITLGVTDVECLEIPSCYTPNGDGINDTWKIVGIDLYPEVKVEIYNRWGDILFKSNGYNQEWDGKYNGQDVPTGSYVYILTFPDNYPEPKTGVVTIIR